MPNRLAASTSPYLAQHADNPVDWFPWGDEAFAEARQRDVPIFLSVGYSSCHWCHVMAHESFEDDEVAKVLNDRFVSVKVDREERPDVDAVYMDAVQAMTGRGGWPMSVFLAPDTLQPFYAGTYWPKLNRPGMPGFLSIIDAIHEAWTERRDEVLESATEITERLRTFHATEVEAGLPDGLVDDAVAFVLDKTWDRELGGFGRAPKFPQAMTIGLLLDQAAANAPRGDESLQAATHALHAMANGGIHDQVGGGFARYSTDAKWLAPHFEKMLYDNALLLAEYARGSALTDDARLAEVARTTVEYLLREMRHDLGGFFSATDADSEGVEGKFFTWSRDELIEVLDGAGLDGQRLATMWGATDHGNWEGTNILHLDGPLASVPVDLVDEVRRAREVLYDHRAERIPPGLDDKVLTSWNALAIRGLAIAGRHLRRPDWIEVATTTADFLREHLVVDGMLHHTWKNGTAAVPALLEDVAYLATALLDLYEATGDTRHVAWAKDLVAQALLDFRDKDGGAFFATAHGAEGLYRRPKDSWDNATPSSNSALALAAVRLSALTGDHDLRDLADEVLRTFVRSVVQSPIGHGFLLQVASFLERGVREIAIVGPPGPERDALVAVAHARPRPGTVLAIAEDDRNADDVPLLQARTPVDGLPAAYVCRDFACERPVTTPAELAALLD